MQNPTQSRSARVAAVRGQLRDLEQAFADEQARVERLSAALAALLEAVRCNDEGGTPRTADQIFAIAGMQAFNALERDGAAAAWGDL